MYSFVHILKTAGTTLTSILRRNFGVRHFDDRAMGLRWMTAADLRRLLRISPHLVSIAGHGTRPFCDLHEVVPDLRYYTFLRDPSRRVLSGFQFLLYTEAKRCRRPPAADEIRERFISYVWHCGNWQARQLANVADAHAAISMIEARIKFVGLVERFDESLVMLRKWMDTDDLNICYTPLNVSAKRHLESSSPAAKPDNLRDINEFLARVPEDSELTEMIREANREDQQLYDYVACTAYPAMRHWYGDGLDSDLATFQQMQTHTTIRFHDTLAGKAYRNFVIKPLSPWLFPDPQKKGQPGERQVFGTVACVPRRQTTGVHAPRRTARSRAQPPKLRGR